MLRRMLVLAGWAAVLSACMGPSYGSTSAHTGSEAHVVTAAEVVKALTALDYRMRYRRIIEDEGGQFIVGRATDKNGESVDFAVGVGSKESVFPTAPEPMIPYRSEMDGSGSGLGNVFVMTNGQSELPGLDGAQRYNRSRMSIDIEKSVFDLVGIPYGP